MTAAIFCPSTRRSASYAAQRCTYSAGHGGEHRYAFVDSPLFPDRPGEDVAPACSVGQVGDREWWCYTHHRDPQVCER